GGEGWGEGGCNEGRAYPLAISHAAKPPHPGPLPRSGGEGEGCKGARGKIAAALALLLVLLAAPIARADTPPDPEAMAKGRGVVGVRRGPGAEDQMVGAMSAGVAELILSANPGKEAEIGPVVEAYFTPLLRQNFGALSDVPATEFARSFTPAELDQLLAFY